MDLILDIPELTIQLLLYLPIRNLLIFGQTCKTLREYLQDKYLWQRICQRDFNCSISQFQSLNGSFRQVYQYLQKRTCSKCKRPKLSIQIVCQECSEIKLDLMYSTGTGKTCTETFFRESYLK
jgi:hypothetical protein